MDLLLTTEPISSATRLMAIASSISLLLLIVQLIRLGKLREGYSILWFLLAGLVLIFSIFTDLLFGFSKLIGIFYAPATLFLILIANLMLISIHYSMVISKHERKLKTLAQEIALLKMTKPARSRKRR